MSLKVTLLILAVLTGMCAGVGFYTFGYAKGFSYFGTEPESCVNCHIMTNQYDSWAKSSHHAVATCVDCHLPHDFVGKYIAKSENGYHHSKAFTLQNFHEPIMIKGKNSRILQHNCVTCHEEMVHDMFRGDVSKPDAISCVHCHASVGHGALPTSIGGRDLGVKKELKKNE
ncbi:cytochrome c nitrite reductase small subunit [bacterium F16]|nr:cytochrome c nitrite reductase small subunit [bacterium F16]